MKFILCLNQDLMSNVVLNLLLPTILHHDVHLFLSDGVGTPKVRIKELIACEYDYPFRELFPALEIESAPLNSAPHRYLSFNEVSRFYGMPLHYITDVNSDEGLTLTRSFAPDAVISIRYGQIFRDDFIALPRLGILNLHSGSIPDYRGILSTFWGMYHDEAHVGATLHWVNSSKIDAGPVISRSSFEVNKQKSLLWHVYHLYDVSIPLLADAINQLDHGLDLESPPINRPLPWPYFTYPTPEHVQEFCDKGYMLTDSTEYDALMARYR